MDSGNPSPFLDWAVFFLVALGESIEKKGKTTDKFDVWHSEEFFVHREFLLNKEEG